MSDRALTPTERLAGRDPVEVLHATPSYLSDYFEAVDEAGLAMPWAPGKWNPQQIVAHLADVEVAFGWRFRQTVAAPGTELGLFNQDAWASRYARLGATLALEAFRASRAWNLAFLASLDLKEWLAEAYHPELGFVSVDFLVTYLAAHDLNHLAQLGVTVPPAG